MQILLNDKKEIVSFAIVGGFDNGIKVNKVPDNFIEQFKPRYYLYDDEKIKVNKNYEEDEFEPYVPPTITEDDIKNGSDKELRSMFTSLQKQVIQANISSSQLAQQNVQIAKQMTNIQNELKELKLGDENNE